MTTDLTQIPIHLRGRLDIHRRKAAEANLSMGAYWRRWEQGQRWCSRCHSWTTLAELSPLRGTPCRCCRRTYQNTWNASRTAARRADKGVRLTMRACDTEQAHQAIAQLAELLAIYDDTDRAPPRTRGACPSKGPCPWVRCRYHLYFDLSEDGLLSIHQPGATLDELEHTCALTAAEGGEMTLEAIGGILNLSRERVRQIEEEALERLADAFEV